MRNFSYYKPPISNTQPFKEVTLERIYKFISGNELKKVTESLREDYNSGKEEEYKKKKSKHLPYVTFGGVFKNREDKGLETPSNYLTIDIDHISDTTKNLIELREELSEDTEIGVRLIFISPSGNGLKVVCETSTEIKDKDSYKEVYKALSHYINTKYKIQVDKTSDISRACLLAYDKEAIFKTGDYKFDPGRHPLPKENKPKPVLREIYNLPGTDGDGIEEIVQRVESLGIDIAPNYTEYLPLCFAFSSLGERGRSLLHRVCRFSPKYNQEQTDKQFDECSKTSGQNIGFFVNLAKSYGIQVTNQKESKTPYKAKKTMNNEVKEEVKDYSSLLNIEDLSELSRKKKEGIKTDYVFGNKEVTLTLKPGGITLICGKSSHGKTRFLQNLALQLLDKDPEKSVLYFHYEECVSDQVFNLFNMYLNERQISLYKTTPNREAIRDYLETGTLNKAKEDTRNRLTPKLEEFKKLYNSGLLRIYNPEYNSQELCRVIAYLCGKIPVQAVFIDYIQYISRDGRKTDRREEIRQICNDLIRLAIDLDLPIILAGQLNRETPNPTDMSEDNLAESSDITRGANTIVCIWDSKFDNVKGGKENYINSEDYRRIHKEGFTLGEEGKMYARITKNRGGKAYVEAVFDYIVETGYIRPNDDCPEVEEESEEPIFY